MDKIKKFFKALFGKFWNKKADEDLGALSRSEYQKYDNTSVDSRRIRSYKASRVAQEINRSAAIERRKLYAHETSDNSDEKEDEDDEDENSYGRNRKHYSGLNDHLHYAMEQNRIPIHSSRTPEKDYMKRNPKHYSGINDHKKYLEELKKQEKSPIVHSDPAELRERARKEVEKAHSLPKSTRKTTSQTILESFRDIEK